MTTPTATADRAAAAVRVTAVHDDAMLARITSTLGLQPVGSFHYDVAAGGRHALVTLEVHGTRWHVTRVQHLLRRLVGVLDVAVGPGPHVTETTTS